MNKRYTVFSLITVAVIGVALALIVANNNTSQPQTLADVKASSKPVGCLATSKSVEPKVDEQSQTFISNAASASIIDVPAGTNVDVYIMSYNKKVAAGSSFYSGDYGSYNFTAEKTEDGSNDEFQGGWKVIDIKPCN